MDIEDPSSYPMDDATLPGEPSAVSSGSDTETSPEPEPPHSASPTPPPEPITSPDATLDTTTTVAHDAQPPKTSADAPKAPRGPKSNHHERNLVRILDACVCSARHVSHRSTRIAASLSDFFLSVSHHAYNMQVKEITCIHRPSSSVSPSRRSKPSRRHCILRAKAPSRGGCSIAPNPSSCVGSRPQPPSTPPRGGNGAHARRRCPPHCRGRH